MHSLSAQHCQPHCANPKMARTWSHMSCLLQLLVPEPSEPLRNRGTCRNPSKPGTTFGTRNLSEPIETWNYLGTRNLSEPIETSNPFGTRNLSEPNLSEPIEWNHLRFPEPVPGTRFLPGTAPARPEHTEIYIVQRPHSILLLGKMWWNSLSKFSMSKKIEKPLNKKTLGMVCHDIKRKSFETQADPSEVMKLFLQVALL